MKRKIIRYDKLFDSLLRQINLLLRLAGCKRLSLLQSDNKVSVCGTFLKTVKFGRWQWWAAMTPLFYSELCEAFHEQCNVFAWFRICLLMCSSLSCLQRA